MQDVEIYDSVGVIADEWDDLADRATGSPFIRPGWFDAWWSAFGKGRLEIVTSRRSGRLVALLPMQRRRGVLYSPTNYHSPEFWVLAEDEVAAEPVCRAVMQAGARRLSFAYLTEGTSDVGWLEAAGDPAGYEVFPRVIEHSPYVDSSGAWEAYEASISKKVLREIRRRTRLLEEKGTLELDLITEPKDLPALLEEGFGVEAASWKGASGTAVMSSSETMAFYQSIGEWAASRSILELAFLRFEGRAVAFDFCLTMYGSHYLVKTGYDPAFRKAGVGTILRHRMLRRAFDSDTHTYEFLGDDAPWKQVWTSTVRPRLKLEFFSASMAGKAEQAAYVHGRPLAKKVLETVKNRGS